MSDLRIPPHVSGSILDAAERAIAEASTDDPATELTLREALRAAFTVALPMYELRLGAELGSVTFACPHHKAPQHDANCISCARYTALLGARHLIEGRDIYASIFPRHALQEAGDDTG